MYNKDWSKLIKSNNGYRSSVGKDYNAGNFTQLAVDEKRLIVVDAKGYLHYVQVTEDAAYIKKLEKVGQVTCIAFNPICKREVLIGLNTGDIRIWKLHVDDDIVDCLLSAHKSAPIHISFYKNYGLTCTRSEVVIWHLQSYQKIHQLRISGRNAVIKKAAFSHAGHIIVLYHNDTMQAWTFNNLDKDTKIDTRSFDSRYIRDFIFTRDGRAMIIAGAKNIGILSTYNWSLLKKLYFCTNFTDAKQLSVVPLPLDGGANKIVALLSSKCNLHFCDVSGSSLLEISEPISGIKKFAVSSAGRYISYIDQEGHLNIIHTEKVISADCFHVKKSVVSIHRPRAHKINDHLDCVRQSMKRELNIKRLIPILKEFGMYPKKYRTIIWSIILKLPANKNAYVALASNITYKKSSSNILKNHPLADKSKASLLAMAMECLLQWCPLLAQSPFIPNLIFPFLMVFQRDPLLAFEASLSILLNYCQKWFEYHPFPPLNILGIIENILLEADPVLLNTFCEHGITSTEYAWPLLQTAMSEILSEDEWLILWDHLISFQKPSLLLFCVIAYSIYSRENIISSIKSSGDIKTFYNTQSHVRAKDLLRIARRLDQEISEHMHPNRYLKDELLQLNQTGPYFLFILEQYPKFITENFCITDPKKLKVQKHLQEYHDKVLKCSEKGRLRDEINAFVKQIHEMRMDEIQKCLQKHSSSINWQLEKMLSNTEKEKLHQFLYKELNNTQCKCKSIETGVSNLSMSSQDCKKLQQDVTKLEYEVQQFLDSLTPCRSKIDIS